MEKLKTNMKDVAEFSDEELINIFKSNVKLAQDIRSIYLILIRDATNEITNIRNILSDFTNRTAVILTLAGLIALLPSLLDSPDVFIGHFLIWIFPFLIISIVCFYFSSKRIGVVSRQIPAAPQDTQLELLFLKARVNALKDILRRNYDMYCKVLEWYRATTVFVYSYIFSFTFNFYLFTLIGKPDLTQSMYVLVCTLFVGLIIYYHGKLLSLKGLNYGPKLKLHNKLG